MFKLQFKVKQRFR